MRSFFSDPITTATTVIAVATVINLIISSLLWRATKRTADVTKNIFDAANRPFLFPVLDAVWDRERRRFNFIIEIRNFGAVPASNIRGKIRATLEDEEVRVWDDLAPASLLLLPQQPIAFPSYIDGDNFTALWERDEELRLSVEFQYKGAGDQIYTYSERYLVSRNLTLFHFDNIQT